MNQDARSLAEIAQQIMRLLHDLNRSERLTIVMVTHNMELVADTDRVVFRSAANLVGTTLEAANVLPEIWPPRAMLTDRAVTTADPALPEPNVRTEMMPLLRSGAASWLFL